MDGLSKERGRDAAVAYIVTPPVVRGEEAPVVVHPLLLQVLARTEEQDPGSRLFVPQQCHKAERLVGLAHAYLVGEIGHGAIAKDVVERGDAVALRLGHGHGVRLVWHREIDQLVDVLWPDRGSERRHGVVRPSFASRFSNHFNISFAFVESPPNSHASRWRVSRFARRATVRRSARSSSSCRRSL